MGVNSYKGGEGKSMERPRSSFDASNLLPTLELGTTAGGLRSTGGGHLPTNSTATSSTMALPSSISDDPELREKEKLLQEISTMRKSIEALRSSSPTTPSSAVPPPLPPLLSLSPTLQAFTPPPFTQSRHSTHSLSGFGEHARRTPSPLASAPVDANPLSPKTEWDDYLAKRVVYRPTSPEEHSTFRREEGDQRSNSFSGGVTNPRLSSSGSTRPGNARRSSMMSMQEIMEGGGDVTGMDRTFGSRRSSTFTLPSALLPPTASSSSKPARPPPAQRTLSQSDLAARHREKIKTLQSPIDERFEASAARAKWEKDKGREREEMVKREEEANTRVERRRRSEVDVEGWRGSVVGKGSIGGRRESEYSLGGASQGGGGGAERRRR